MSKAYKHVVIEVVEDGFLNLFEWLLNCRSIKEIKEYKKDDKTILSATFKNNKYITERRLNKVYGKVSDIPYVKIRKDQPTAVWIKENDNMTKVL